MQSIVNIYAISKGMYYKLLKSETVFDTSEFRADLCAGLGNKADLNDAAYRLFVNQESNHMNISNGECDFYIEMKDSLLVLVPSVRFLLRDYSITRGYQQKIIDLHNEKCKITREGHKVYTNLIDLEFEHGRSRLDKIVKESPWDKWCYKESLSETVKFFGLDALGSFAIAHPINIESIAQWLITTGRVHFLRDYLDNDDRKIFENN